MAMTYPRQERATVVSLAACGAHHRLVPAVDGIAEHVLPGHFVAVAIGPARSSALLLRRAFSIHWADPVRGLLEVAFTQRGLGTQQLASMRAVEELDVVAPLGTPFPLAPHPGPAVLVGGGHGIAPLIPLARRLSDAGAPDVPFVCGAASAVRLLGVEQARCLSGRVTVTTDDGSAGVRGQVTGQLPA
ncbi:hypothetical protein AB0M94_35205 [Streptomyces xanthochromogenes]|uniref:hypothetical protein n=1 Tax=Streptomyces xanthochromogenes TaxID=67384 RepID=UPI0034180A21